MVAKGLDQITRGRPMRGLALKEMERWNQFYAPHTMGWVRTIHQASLNSWGERPSEYLVIYYAMVPKALDQHAVAGPHARVRVKGDGEVEPILCAPYHGVCHNYTPSEPQLLRRTS